MLKPERLKIGDKVAIVSLSSGMLGEKEILHKYELGKKRLEENFGLNVVQMPNTLKGKTYIYEHPEERAKDLMQAFSDKSIKAIICAIGGDDTIRLLPYIDYEIIRSNPKILMGFSDTTANHLMMYKAGVISYYGPSLITDFARYIEMYDYTENAVKDLLFNPSDNYEIKKCDYWTNELIPWCEENINKDKTRLKDEKGYEVIQGSGRVTGELLGGCLDALPMYIGTEVWPTLEEWKGKILFLETSEDKPDPELVKYYLRNLGAQGILKVINGIICGKPQGEKYYEEYKEMYKKVLREFGREDMPVIYNVNFGHSEPIGIIPYGIECELDADNKRITLLEKAVE
jgi:muramoyltetrapeptide carboxypeptidase LdcA involved in peptidoglycan recycling